MKQRSISRAFVGAAVVAMLSLLSAGAAYADPETSTYWGYNPSGGYTGCGKVTVDLGAHAGDIDAKAYSWIVSGSSCTGTKVQGYAGVIVDLFEYYGYPVEEYHFCETQSAGLQLSQATYSYVVTAHTWSNNEPCHNNRNWGNAFFACGTYESSVQGTYVSTAGYYPHCSPIDWD